MNYKTVKWVKPEDLNPNQSLFGGRLLQWIDEEAALFAVLQLGNKKVVTKFISEINFVSSAKQGDIIEINLAVSAFGKTSLTLHCEVRNQMTQQIIITVDRIVMVNLDDFGQPFPHGIATTNFI